MTGNCILMPHILYMNQSKGLKLIYKVRKLYLANLDHLPISIPSELRSINYQIKNIFDAIGH